MSVLEVKDLTAGYGPVRVLHDVTFSIDTGTVAAVLGANGAGKTTLLRALSGMLPGTKGTVTFDGRKLVGMRTERIARLGLSHVPEGRGTFPDLTVEENLAVGALLSPAGRPSRADLDRMYELFPPLARREHAQAGLLSGGEQQMLALARALLGRPKLLLLDEPSMGLAPLVVRQIFEVLRTVVADEGLTCLLVEQNAQLALGMADYAYVLTVGEITAEGPAAELADDQAIRNSYLAL
ncbi:ABC transporter ATP-binding protein [Actinophytocola oryzae]|uniref:Amino acid/amide ABC transporter ATP-binding protein 2 (HAAT family) n=1 Tax=Actinophytocola oryzae TaxID=502181 RepID=A0A4R7W1S9_9PSEU|nr:ABC transporter ATP-binding protein [Actinophytocola oryzae]TDV56516.1 amino acid/amide ABC transporter ATP-binding protein 2 (HAAT family) [Actinophytocola oryzae]